MSQNATPSELPNDIATLKQMLLKRDEIIQLHLQKVETLQSQVELQSQTCCQVEDCRACDRAKALIDSPTQSLVWFYQARIWP